MESQTLTAWIVFVLGLYFLVAAVQDIRKKGVNITNGLSALGGFVVVLLLITMGFWDVIDLGRKFMDNGAERVQTDDILVGSVDNVLDGDIAGLNRSVHIQKDSDASDGNSDYSSSGPAVDSHQSDGVNVQINKPTPVPSPTPIHYDQKVPKPVVAWADWFTDNYYHTNGDATLAQIPIGVRCTFVKVEDPVFSPQKWQMTCSDKDNPDYGVATVDLNEAAIKGLGALDGKTLEGKGKLGPQNYPKGIFVETSSQSMAPAFAPGPAPASSNNGPDAFATQFTGWLVVDSPSGIDCVWDNGSKVLPLGSRHRFDPKSLRNNVPGQIPQVEVLMNPQGATCWGEIWSGRSHFE
jgi:hypothetical protein